MTLGIKSTRNYVSFVPLSVSLVFLLPGLTAKLHKDTSAEEFKNAPVGVQIACRRFQEEKVISILKEIEALLKNEKYEWGSMDRVDVG